MTIMKMPFPWKLNRMLEEAEKPENGFANIVSWLPDGKAFKIHDPDAFVDQVMRTYFNQSKIKSFTRQLYIYGFLKIPDGPREGAFYHPEFSREDKQSCFSLRRNPAGIGDRRRRTRRNKSSARNSIRRGSMSSYSSAGSHGTEDESSYDSSAASSHSFLYPDARATTTNFASSWLVPAAQQEELLLLKNLALRRNSLSDYVGGGNFSNMTVPIQHPPRRSSMSDAMPATNRSLIHQQHRGEQLFQLRDPPPRMSSPTSIGLIFAPDTSNTGPTSTMSGRGVVASTSTSSPPPPVGAPRLLQASRQHPSWRANDHGDRADQRCSSWQQSEQQGHVGDKEKDMYMPAKVFHDVAMKNDQHPLLARRKEEEEGNDLFLPPLGGQEQWRSGGGDGLLASSSSSSSSSSLNKLLSSHSLASLFFDEDDYQATNQQQQQQQQSGTTQQQQHQQQRGSLTTTTTTTTQAPLPEIQLPAMLYNTTNHEGITRNQHQWWPQEPPPPAVASLLPKTKHHDRDDDHHGDELHHSHHHHEDHSDDGGIKNALDGLFTDSQKEVLDLLLLSATRPNRPEPHLHEEYY